MKNFYSYLGVSLVAIAALSSCNKELTDPNEGIKGGIPFEISAASVDTKTSIDGLTTKWVANDAINLFHAEAGKTTYTSDGQFTITTDNLKSNKFTGTLASSLEPGNYDWYALYPYTSLVETPANNSKGYVTVGGTSQKQEGNGSMAHLCGKVCPLYGVSKSVDGAATPAIEMKHLTSIIEVNVTNISGEDLTVAEVSFTGSEGEDIAGTYFINFASSPVVYTKSGDKYVSNTATLSVSNGEAIAVGNSAKFYIAVKPFTAASGSELKLSVNGYEKTISLEKDVTFTAGKIKKLNFDFDVAQTTYIWDLSSDSTTEATTEKIAWTNAAADMVCEKGKSTTATNNYYPGTGTSGKPYTSTRFYLNSNFSITPKTGKSVTYYVFEAATTDYAAALANSTWTNAEAVVDGTTVTVIAKDPSDAVSAVIGATCGFTKVECHTDAAPVYAPIITANPTSIVVPAAGDDCTILYSIKFPVDGKSISATSDQSWVNTFDYSTTGEISFVVDANSGDARTATVTLSYEGAEDVIISVTQKSAGSTGGEKEYTLTITTDSFNSTSYAANNKDKTTEAIAGDGSRIDVTWYSNQIMLQSSAMQWQKNTGYLYNKTDLGQITSVTVNSTAGSFTTYYGTTENPTSGTTVGGGFFNVKVGNATGKTTSVVIVFKK